MPPVTEPSAPESSVTGDDDVERTRFSTDPDWPQRPDSGNPGS